MVFDPYVIRGLGSKKESDAGRGPKGEKVELRLFENHIQWRHEGELWIDLIPLNILKGKDGNNGNDGKIGKDGKDGRDGDAGQEGEKVEFRLSETHIQWRYEGGDWVDLIPLNMLKGKDGDDGKIGKDGKDGNDGNDGKAGKDGKDGHDGKSGQKGEKVELRLTETHIQWRYEGGSWVDLIPLNILKGKDGKDGKDGKAGKDGEDGEDGTMGMPGQSGSPGKDGKDGTGDKSFNFPFLVSAEVTVAHNLDKFVAVSVFDSAGDEVVGDVNYIDMNNIIVSFTSAFSGTIICN